MPDASTRGQADHRAVEAIERVLAHPVAAGLPERLRIELAAAVAIRRHAEEWWGRRGVTIEPYPDPKDEIRGKLALHESSPEDTIGL